MTTSSQATLGIAAATWRQAQSDLTTAREQLTEAVREAIDAGTSQSEAARIVGVDRLTIRKWLSQN